jgi:hypothetical protein
MGKAWNPDIKTDASISIGQTDDSISNRSPYPLPPEVRAALLRGDRVAAALLLKESLDKGGTTELAPVEAAISSGNHEVAASLLRTAIEQTIASAPDADTPPHPTFARNSNPALDEPPRRGRYSFLARVALTLICAAGFYFVLFR